MAHDQSDYGVTEQRPKWYPALHYVLRGISVPVRYLDLLKDVLEVAKQRYGTLATKLGPWEKRPEEQHYAYREEPSGTAEPMWTPVPEGYAPRFGWDQPRRAHRRSASPMAVDTVMNPPVAEYDPHANAPHPRYDAIDVDETEVSPDVRAMTEYARPSKE